MKTNSIPIRQCVALVVMLVSGQARTEEIADLTRKLDSVRQRMLTARASSDVTVRMGLALPSRVMKWAFSGEKRYRELIAGFPSTFAEGRTRRRIPPAGGEILNGQNHGATF